MSKVPQWKIDIVVRKKLRDFHFNNQLGCCAYCDIEMDPDAKPEAAIRATLEHVIPQSMGGRNSINETIAICRKCNKKRSNFPLELDLLLRVFVYRGVDALPAIVFNIKHLIYRSFYIASGKSLRYVQPFCPVFV